MVICEDEAHLRPGIGEHYGSQHFAQRDIGMAAMALCCEEMCIRDSLNAIGAQKLSITAMPETGVALGRINDGRLSGYSFAAKGGSVGTCLLSTSRCV